MKKISKFMSAAMLATALFASCSETVPPEYESNPGLYFYWGIYETGFSYQKDSTSFAFFAKQVPDGGEFLQYIDVRTVGFPADVERPFRVVQTNAGDPDAAVAGVHYVPFDDPRMEALLKIPANATKYLFPVICINRPELKEKSVRLVLELDNNQYFDINMNKMARFVINFSDKIEQPTSWGNNDGANWHDYFGKWSEVKMLFIMENLGFYDFDEEDKAPQMPREYYARKMYRLLREYNAAHPGDPMRDENEDLIEFPSRWEN